MPLEGSREELAAVSDAQTFRDRGWGEQIAFIHAKLAVIVWAILYMLYAPIPVIEELGGWLVIFSGTIAIIGSCIGICGLFISNTGDVKKRIQGSVMELSGLYICLCGPVSFAITALYLAITLDLPRAYPFTGLAYALSAFTLSRIITVRNNLNGRVSWKN